MAGIRDGDRNINIVGMSDGRNTWWK